MLSEQIAEERKKGDPVNDSPGAAALARKARWSLSISSDVCGGADVEDGIRMLLDKLPADPAVWYSLSQVCDMDLFCGLFFGSRESRFRAVSGSLRHAR
jgi:hypothetical protein